MHQESMTIFSIAQMIDLSAVQAENDSKYIRQMVEKAKEFQCIAVYPLPSWIPFTRQALGTDSGILLGGPVGFPSGGHTTSIKVAETRELIDMGCNEIDMVLNVGKLRSGLKDEVYKDIQAVVEAAAPVPVKVILECHYLSQDEILTGCDLTVKAAAAWVKTGTGWPATGATVERVQLISRHVGDTIQVKAAGGVRDLETLLALYDAGARRFGVGLNSALKIFKQMGSDVAAE